MKRFFFNLLFIQTYVPSLPPLGSHILGRRCLSHSISKLGFSQSVFTVLLDCPHCCVFKFIGPFFAESVSLEVLIESFVLPMSSGIPIKQISKTKLDQTGLEI